MMRKNRPRGQISVLMIFSLVPMFTLFAFVVNIGMLVHAKISLQNAADLAAYAGAATQARQLTHISHLNYMMRQTYKKFVFKYYVLGNLSLKCWPRADGSTPSGCKKTDKFDWINVRPDGSDHDKKFPGVPMVCISLNPTSNMCQLAVPVPLVQAPTCNATFDPTCKAITDASAQIAEIQKKACVDSATINRYVLANWLFSPDVDPSANKSRAELETLVSGDLGLIPEELMHEARVNTVVKYVNAPPATVTSRTITQLHQEFDLAKVERPIMAFETAKNNLNPNVFEPDQITMAELLPKGTPLLTLQKNQLPRFQAGYAYMKAGDGSTSCQIDIGNYEVADPTTIGFYKDPKSFVFYAVKLTARARLLFNPFPIGNPDDGIELSAYAAAIPFGSRIGPKLDMSKYIVKGTSRSAGGADPKPFDYPTLPLSADESTLTLESTDVLQKLTSALKTSGAPVGSTSNVVNGDALKSALRLAAMPDEVEVGQYNIPVDVDKKGGFLPYFQHNNAFYTFWAPIATPETQMEFKDRIKNAFEALAKNMNSMGGTDAHLVDSGKMKQDFVARFDKTIEGLRGKQNYDIARMEDPVAERDDILKPSGKNPAGTMSWKINASKKNVLASSYTTERDYDHFKNGRDGYSVKLISFNMLVQKPGRLSNVEGDTRWTPIKDIPGGEMQTLLQISH
jgi:hypothetical protein